MITITEFSIAKKVAASKVEVMSLYADRKKMIDSLQSTLGHLEFLTSEELSEEFHILITKGKGEIKELLRYLYEPDNLVTAKPVVEMLNSYGTYMERYILDSNNEVASVHYLDYLSKLLYDMLYKIKAEQVDRSREIKEMYRTASVTLKGHFLTDLSDASRREVTSYSKFKKVASELGLL